FYINKDDTALKYSPVYFQNFIKKNYEVRLTIVDKKYFPVKIMSRDEVDWRKFGNDVKYSNCDIPEEILEKCMTFMQFFSMKFGCFDFIIQNECWYFLEMNANGQWLWLEKELGLDISKAIIDFLNGA
ncbi:MAG: hypothetical protein AAF621_02605, partial [Pseudomonadota bacterium]